MEKSRRNFVGLLALAPISIFSVGRALAADSACYDPQTLPLNQKNRRRSIGYVSASPDAKRQCSLCAFFTAGQGACGSCQMLSGGAVEAGGVCNSFAPKG